MMPARESRVAQVGDARVGVGRVGYLKGVARDLNSTLSASVPLLL